LKNDEKFLYYILNNIPNILPIFSNNFPFSFSQIPYITNSNLSKFIYKNVIKIYLNLNNFINKFYFNDIYEFKKSDIVLIGYTAKIISNTKNEPIGDYSNSFLKCFLQKNNMNVSELLIFNIKNIKQIFHLLQITSKLRKYNSYILYPVKFKGENVSNYQIMKDKCKNILENKIKSYINCSFEISDIDKENLLNLLKNLDSYLDFVYSKEFISYLLSLGYSIRNALCALSPKVVIINSISGLVDRLTAYISKFLNMKVVFIPHGIGENINSKFYKYFSIDKIPLDLYISPCYDKDNLYMLYDNLKICNYGAIIYGYTKNHCFFNKSLDNNKKLNTDSLTLLYATQPLVKDKVIDKYKFKKFLFKLFEHLSRINCNIIIKVHPRDDIAFYKDIINTLQIKNVEFSTKGPPFFISEIKRADIALVHFSSIAYEAILAGTPVISIIPEELERYVRSYKNVNVPVFYESEIEKFINILSKSNVKDYLSKLRESQQQILEQTLLSNDSLSLFLTTIEKLLKST